MMDRRTLLAVLCLLSAPRAAKAQPVSGLPTVGFLGLRDTGSIGKFYARLRELGWIDGQTVRIERGLWGERRDRIPELAMELVRKQVTAGVAPLGKPRTMGPSRRRTRRDPGHFEVGRGVSYASSASRSLGRVGARWGGSRTEPGQ